MMQFKDRKLYLITSLDASPSKHSDQITLYYLYFIQCIALDFFVSTTTKRYHRPMNYLMHFYLADHTNTSIVGALLGDFVKGSRWQSQPKSEQIGILLHRRIDSWTDQWIIDSDLIHQVPKQHRRLAGIALDVYFDHLLTQHWNDFHPSNLNDFTQDVYLQLGQSNIESAPRHVIENMAQYDWLVRYQQLDIIERALTRIGQRFKRPQPIADLLPYLETNRVLIQLRLFEALPQLKHLCLHWAETITADVTDKGQLK